MEGEPPQDTRLTRLWKANHSHFVLADSDEWGGETGLLMAVAAARARNCRVAVVLAGGGEVAKTEVVQSIRRGWPVFVIQGTGGLADSILELWRTHRVPARRPASRLLPGVLKDGMPPPPSSIADADLREIVSEGDIRAVTGTEPARPLRDLVTRGESVLTTELAGWVQQMSDTLKDLKNRQAEAADRVRPAGAADPSVNPPQGSPRPGKEDRS